MKLRKLEQREHIQTRPLYEDAFPEDSRGFVDYYYTEKTRDNQIYVIEEDGDIRAMLHLNPYKLAVNNQQKTVHYIVAVATRKAYRKRGYMAALIKQALRDMQERGESFTFLMPAAESIYLPHDFRTVYRQEKRWDTQTGNPEENRHIAAARVSDCREMAETAQAYLAQNYQVFALRDAAYYERLMKEYASDGGAIMVYRDGGRIADMKIRMPGEDADRHPKIMTRIADVKRMLLSLELKSLTSVSFCVTDRLIEANNCCLILTGTEFSGVMLMEGPRENSEGTLTIGALTSLVFGAKSVEEVCREEEVTMTPRTQEELKKLIPLTHIYLNETV